MKIPIDRRLPRSLLILISMNRPYEPDDEIGLNDWVLKNSINLNRMQTKIERRPIQMVYLEEILMIVIRISINHE